MTTFPDRFKHIHLDRCAFDQRLSSRRTSPGWKPISRSWSAPTPRPPGAAGRAAAGFSAENLGIYATFAFRLPDKRCLPLLSIAAGVAVADMLEHWTGKEFRLEMAQRYPGRREKDRRHPVREHGERASRIICLVGIGINVNQLPEDFPAELRERAGSLRLLTGREWPLGEGRERLAASMASWLRQLAPGRPAPIVDRARGLSRSFLGQEISFSSPGADAGAASFAAWPPTAACCWRWRAARKRFFTAARSSAETRLPAARPALRP